MKVTFLGTGTSQGVPIIGCKCDVCKSQNPKDNRLRSSVLIEEGGNNFVIDTGPDFRQQMLRENVEKMDAVIFTHEHRDHLAGFDDIRAFNFIQKKKMEVYASDAVQQAIIREFPYIFTEIKYPGVPEINFHTITNEPFQINKVQFNPIQVYHHKMPVFGYRVEDFTYITDANFISEEEKMKIKGSKVIVINALRREEHISHYTFDQAINLMKELKPERAYLTHISHQLGLLSEVEKELPEFISLAYDGLKIEI